MNDDNQKFSLEDILEEQRRMREQGGAPATLPEEPEAQEAPGRQEKKEAPRPQKPQPRSAGVPEAEQEPEEGHADLNTYATGNISVPGYRSNLPQAASQAPDREAEQQGKKKKKKKGGLFGRKRRPPDYDEGEDDMYYGLQLKPIDEYRKGFDPSTGEFTLPDEGYKDLFDDSKQAIDDEVEKNFQRLQQERRRRVVEAVHNAGVDEDELIDEFGVVAPMPVTAFAADPYARQHGIEVEGGPDGEERLPGFQKAMMDSSTDKTMEIKLNVLNNTVEIQRVKDMPAVSQESVDKILSSAEEPAEEPAYEEPAYEEPTYEESAVEEPTYEEPTYGEPTYEESAYGESVAEEPAYEESGVSREGGEPEEAGAEGEASPSRQPQRPAPGGRPLGEIPQVASIYEYRFRGIPTHVINADVIQSALLSESEELSAAAQAREEALAPRRRVRNKRLEEEREQEELPDSENQESIEDYTGPEDARSISNELRGDMRELTLRMMITGVCTALLAVANVIFGTQFSSTATKDLGSMPIVYIILTLVFAGVAIGVCYRTIGNGLKALLSLNANSDSAAAVAAVAVLVQTVFSIFYSSDLSGGKLHLYAVVLCAVLFVNAAGKLTMIRRIHSNFRFVTSREQKYSVRTYDDYNTSLKMVKDSVAEKPLIAYQCKAGFLKRFLELSYSPDPAETASQFMAPIGLVSSLVLCIACLLITRSVPSALSAFAASCCACVAFSNMLAVNLPVSRLCKTARRAGAMVVGYEAVEELGDVNSVMLDAEDVFPRGTVVLEGIKTFGNRIAAEEAIIAASALMKEMGGPLSGVFDQVISENEDALPKVESVTYEDACGIIAKVDGKQIYLGNRTLLVNHRIEAPAREEETQYASGNKAIVYIAVDTAISAMMVLTYTADRRKKNELQRLEDSGISIVVRTTDPNVSSALISRLFAIDSASVAILEGPQVEEGRKLMDTEIPRADARVATKGRVESMMNVLSACVEEKRSVNLLVMLQNIALILGFVLVAFMSCFGGLPQLTSFVLFAFEMFWLLVILVIPKLRKP